MIPSRGSPPGPRKKNGQSVPQSRASSWYDVLDVPPDATQNQIDVGYEKALALIEGRAIGGYLMLDPDAARTARDDIETAYLILSDKEERARFDAELSRHQGTASAPSRPADEPQKPTPEGADPLAKRASGGRPPPGRMPADPIQADPTPAAPLPGERPPGDAPRLVLRILAPVEDVSRPVSQGAGPVHESGGAPGSASAPPDSGDLLFGESEVNGQVIRRLREARGMSLEQIAALTHILRVHLMAIEENDLPLLPARVYLRGFLTQVARVLRVDPKHLSEGYLAFVQRYRK
jgi:hypothetical protein